MNKRISYSGGRSLHRVWLGIGLVLTTACGIQGSASEVGQVVTKTATLNMSTPTLQHTATLTHSQTPTHSVTPEPSATVQLPTETPVPPVASVTPIQGTQQLKLQATAAPETTFEYVFPIQDADVSYGKSHHDYPATDIFCAEGSPFVAVTSGVVTILIPEDTWDPKQNDPALRSGLAVGIIGDDGVQYYGSHLSAIAEGLTLGMRVQAGDLLGYTGKSGNARNTPPHLHFGISRPTDPDDWRVRRGEMNPYEFLQAWRAGKPLQPVFDVEEE